MERRNQSRTDLHVPLYLLSAEQPDLIQTETENVSLNGFFCYTKVLLAPGERVKFLLLFPEAVRDSQKAKATYLHGIAEVARVVVGRVPLEFGIGCRLMTYRVLSHVDLSRRGDIMDALLEAEHFQAGQNALSA